MIASLTQDKYPNYPAFLKLVRNRYHTDLKIKRLIDLIEQHDACPVKAKLDACEWIKVDLLNISPLSALKAVLYGEITSIQMATLFQFKNGYSIAKETLTIVPLFIDGAVSKLAKEWIESTLSMNQADTHRHLNDRELEAFFDEMRAKPLSEQRFFTIPNRAPPEDRQGNVETLSHVLHELQFDVFSNMSQKRWMIPSFGMMEAFGHIYGKNGPIKIEPVIGFSSRREIIRGMQTRVRDFGFELSAKTISFDEVEGPSFEGPAHDFFHYHNFLILPPLFLEAFGEIAEFLLDESECAEGSAKEWLSQIVDAIADQENADLKKDDPGTLNFIPSRSALFWFLLARNIDEVSQDKSPTFMTPHLRTLVYHLLNDRNRWISQYQIDVLEVFAYERGETPFSFISLTLIAQLLHSLQQRKTP